MGGTMTCGQARRLLWPDGGPRATSRTVIIAQEHLAACAACQRFVDDMRALGGLVHDLAPREQAPADIRERLYRALAHARVTQLARRRRRWWHTAVAAVAIVAISVSGLAIWQSSDDGEPSVIATLVEDHVRAISDASIASNDPLAIEQWLTERVDFALFVPTLPGAQLRGARICVMDGRRGAVVQYDAGGVGVSYFVVPDERPLAASSMHAELERATQAGYHVVSWREPGLLHAMIGNFSESQLAGFARACIEQARRRVALLIDRIRFLEV